MAKAIHMMIRVLEEGRSVAFYDAAFDLKIADRFAFDGFTLIYLRNPEIDFEVELTVNHDRTEPYQLGDGYGHVAFAVDDLEAEHARLSASGLSPKWSTLYAELPKGEATGKLEVRPESFVQKIEHDATGKVTGVVYLDGKGVQQRQKARIVAVAGNSIESPRLLLNSASNQFKDGLGNSSGQVGRNYMRHLTGSVYGVFEKPVKMWRGTTMAGIVQDEAHHDAKRGFVGGYELETLSIGLPFMAAFLDPGAWGREFTSALDSYENMAGMWIVGEDMPQESNRITLSDKKDKGGIPVANVHFDDHPNDLAMRAHAYKQGAAIYDAVGATRTFPTVPYPSTHNLGTNLMSANAKDGVVNKWGQSHDIKNLFVSDGSVFTTGGAENPTLTIVALALRQADYIEKQMAQKAI